MSPRSDASEVVPAVDDLLDTLRHPMRRVTVRYFERRSSPVASLDELVSHVTDTRESYSRGEVRIQLVHNHLPKLADREWLEYDPESWEIRYHGHDSAGQLLDEVRGIF